MFVLVIQLIVGVILNFNDIFINTRIFGLVTYMSMSIGF